MPGRGHVWLVAAIIVAGLLSPVGIYWATLGRVPTVTAPVARQRLAENKAVLVDVRTPGEFAQRHVTRAVNWPLDSILAARSPADVPAELAGRELYVICAAGFRSVQATARLRELGIGSVTNVRGGLQEWIAFAPAYCPLATGSDQPPGDPDLPFHVAPWYEQWTAVVTGFGVKPVYMVLSLAMVVLLWRARGRDLASFRWAMAAFFGGELFCLLNYLVSNERSLIFEYLHGSGMALAFGFTAYAVLAGVDDRLFRYSDSAGRCAAITLCRSCMKQHADAPCGFRRVLMLMIPALAIMAAAPLLVRLRTDSYNTRIFGTLYSYVHPVVHQAYEQRFLPLAAIVLFAAAFVVLLREGHPVLRTKILLAAGLGAMGFSYFRLLFFYPFAETQVWFAAAEEISELVYILAAGGILWIFRHALLSRPGQIVAADR